MPSEDKIRLHRRRLLGVAVAAPLAAITPTLFARPAAADTTPASVVYASDFGFDPLDSTPFLQQALDSAADTVIIDDVGADWVVRPLFVNRDNLTVVVESGVTVRAKPGGYPSNTFPGNSLLTIANRTGIHLSGYGATLAMNKPEYTAGEWRHVVNVLLSRNITIEGFTLRDSGGDGIYIGRAQLPLGITPYCQNITVRDVICDNHRRNALSVISVDGLLVEGSQFINTSGTAPNAGIDFEPNNSRERLTNIIIRDCEIRGTDSSGLMVAAMNMRPETAPLSILCERVTFGERRLAGNPTILVYGASGGTANGDVNGTVEFKDCLVETGPPSGSVGIGQKRAHNSFAVIFTQTTFRELDCQSHVFQPFTLSAGRMNGLGAVGSEYGGIRFTDCILSTDEPPPFLHARNQPAGHPGLAEVRGNIAVYCPLGVSVDYGPNPNLATIDLSVTELTEPPATAVSVSAPATTPPEQPAIVTFTRQSENLEQPLAIAYTITGMGRRHPQFDAMTRVATIHSGQRSTTVSISAPQTKCSQPNRVIELRITAQDSYQVQGTGTARYAIGP